MKREDLLKALEIVRPGLATNSPIEQASSFAFMGKYIVTYNDELSIRHPVEGLDLTGAVRAQELYALLGKIKKEDIEISIEENELRLKSGRARAGIPVAAEVKLPLEELGKKTEWKPLPDKFVVGLQMTIPSAAGKSGNSVLTCISVRKDGTLESTNNFRITRYQIGKEIPTKDFLLPADSANEIVKYSLHEIAESKGWIHFKTEQGGTILSCRTFSGEWPDLDKFLNSKGTAFDLPKTLEDLLSRAQIFGNKDPDSGEEVTISISDNKLKVRGQNEYGWFEETANIHYEKEAISFVVNPTNLKMISSSTRNCVLTPNSLKFEGENWKHVIALKAK